MATYNHVVLVGRLGRDPDLRFTANGHPVCSFSIATDKNRKVDNEWQTETHWHNIVIWGAGGERAAEKFSKGDLVLCEGEIENQDWEDRDGKKRRTTQINTRVFRLMKARNEQPKQGEEKVNTPNPQPEQKSGFDQGFTDDDIPF